LGGINERNGNGLIPVREAVRSGMRNVVKRLPETVRVKSAAGLLLPVHEAARRGKLSVVRYLVEQLPD
jgi:hypothetical protein